MKNQIEKIMHREMNLVFDILLTIHINVLSDHIRSHSTSTPFNLDVILRFSSYTLYYVQNGDTIVLRRTSAIESS